MKPLGSFRFALALCVLYGHAFRLLEDSVPAWAASSGAIAAQLGVLMFFVVSGYIICFALEQHYAGRPLAFLANRALRIYPVHLVCYVLALLLLWKVPATEYGWVPKITRENAAFTADLFALPWATFLPNPPMWSVALELQFYAVIGLATFLPQRRAACWLLGMSASIGTLAGISAGHVHGPLFCFFALGAGLYYISSTWGVLLAGVALAATIRYMLVLTERTDIPNGPMTLTALAALALLAWLIHRRRPAGRLDIFLGGLSYPLYAVHVPLLAITAQGKQGWGWFLAIDALCVAAAIALYLGIERPVLRLRTALRRRADVWTGAKAAAG